MSHLSSVAQFRTQARAHWIAALSALLALVATTAVVLVLAIGGDSSSTSSAAVQQTEPVAPSQSGPDESAVAVAVALRPGAGPDENRTAIAVR